MDIKPSASLLTALSAYAGEVRPNPARVEERDARSKSQQQVAPREQAAPRLAISSAEELDRARLAARDSSRFRREAPFAEQGGSDRPAFVRLGQIVDIKV